MPRIALRGPRRHSHRLIPVTTAVVGAPGSARRYLHSLWLLSARDLKVRYSTSALGYLWSILDPLAMSLIYWFVFTLVFDRLRVGETPYIVFLLAAHVIETVGTQEYVLRTETFLERLRAAYGDDAVADVQAHLSCRRP